MTQEQVEKRIRAEVLILQAERQLRVVALDFGMQFAKNHRQRIKTLSQELSETLVQDDERKIDQSIAELQDALSELNREVRKYYAPEEDDNFFNS